MIGQLKSIGMAALIAASLFSLLINTSWVNARVVCVDKYNFTSFVPCSDQNAIAGDSIRSSHISVGGNTTAVLLGGNMTSVSGNVTSSSNSSSAKYGFLNYKNPGHGIKIEYPSGWTFQENTPYEYSVPNSTRDIVRFSSPQALGAFLPYVAIDTLDFSNLTLHGILNNRINNYEHYYPYFKVISTSTNGVLAGQAAYVLVFDDLDKYSSLSVRQMEVGNGKYSILYYATKLDYSRYLPTAQKMIDSFVSIPTAIQATTARPSNASSTTLTAAGMNKTAGMNATTTSTAALNYTGSAMNVTGVNTTGSGATFDPANPCHNAGPQETVAQARACIIWGQKGIPHEELCKDLITNFAAHGCPEPTARHVNSSGHATAYWDGYNQGKTDKRNGNPIDAAATCDSFSFGNNKDWSHCVAGYDDAISGGGSGNPQSTPTTKVVKQSRQYDLGYSQGISDWNQYSSDLSHSFECPLVHVAPHSDYCKGYDAALMFENSDH